jgi:SmpA / OmlA family
MQLSHRLNFALLAAIVFLSGCASFDGRGLKPGEASEADVRQLMGAPAAVRPVAGGGSVLSYPRGPMGLYTYMVRIDGNGRLVAIEQVLNRAHFDKVRSGMSKDDVSRMIGPPGAIRDYLGPNQIAWDYRYRDVWEYVSVFSVVFADDKVDATFSLREERGSKKD